MTNDLKKIKVSIVGFGNIGRALTHLLLNNVDYHFDINVMDPSEEIEGSLIDLGHAVFLQNKCTLVLNDVEHFNHSEFIFHCAGVGVPMGASRLEIADQNISLTKNIFSNFESKVDTKIIVISNPVDVISYYTYLSSGLSAEKVIGTGTLLDSVRMNYYVSQMLKRPMNIDAVLLGEHGQSIALVDSLSSIDGHPFETFLTKEEIGRCLSNVKTAAHKIKMTQGSSIYGAVDCAFFIMNSILSDAQIVKPLSVLLPAEICELFNTKPIYMSVLSRITKEGAFPLNGMTYLPEELEDITNSAKVIGKFL